jgi:hypothetical protein
MMPQRQKIEKPRFSFSSGIQRNHPNLLGKGSPKAPKTIVKMNPQEDDASTVADLEDFAERFNLNYLPCKHCHCSAVPIAKFQKGITLMMQKGSTKLPKICDRALEVNNRLNKYHNDIYNRKNALKKLVNNHPWLLDSLGQMYQTMKEVHHPLYRKYVDLEEKIQTATQVYEAYKQSIAA